MLITSPKDDSIIVDIDGFPSSHWRICLSERPPIPTPKRQVQIDSVLGKLGGFYTKFGWEDMDVKLTFNFLEDVVEFKSFKQQIPHIRTWLENGKIMQFSDEPETYFIMRNVVFSGDIGNDMVEYGEFDVTVTLAPFGRVVEETPVNIMNGKSSISTPYSIMTFNASTETSYPRFVFETTDAAMDLSIRNVLTGDTNRIRISRQANSGVPAGRATYVIDCELKLVYWLDTDGVKHLMTNYTTDSEFPMLTVGENQISLTGIDIGSEASFSKFDMYRNMLR